MDQPLRRNARLLFTVLFISQVCGTPIFWSQPDCYQNQFSDVQYDTYESYQGPSYQDTLKSMVDETLRAINEIVQITVQVTKQEIASLSNVFQNPPNVNCNDSGESAVAPEDFQFTAPQQPVKFPGDSMDNSYPLYENPPVAELPHPTADDKNSSGTTQSSNVLDNKVGTDSNSSSQPSTQPENVTSHTNSSSTAQSSAVLDDKVGTDGSSSSQPSTQPENVTSHKNSSSTTQPSAVLDDKVGTDGSQHSTQTGNVTSHNNSEVPNNVAGNMSTSILSQNTSTDNYLIGNNIDSTPLSTITTDGELITTPLYSADNNDALLFSTELSITEDETSLSTLTAGSTTLAYDVTTAEIPTVINRKPKL